MEEMIDIMNTVNNIVFPVIFQFKKVDETAREPGVVTSDAVETKADWNEGDDDQPKVLL